MLRTNTDDTPFSFSHFSFLLFFFTFTFQFVPHDVRHDRIVYCKRLCCDRSSAHHARYSCLSLIGPVADEAEDVLTAIREAIRGVYDASLRFAAAFPLTKQRRLAYEECEHVVNALKCF